MKILIVVVFLASPSFAELKCPKRSFDWRGTCTADIQPEKIPASAMVQPSDEEPPRNPQPEWETGKVKVIDAPNLLFEDQEWDRSRAEADRQGKEAAGLPLE